MTSSRVSELWMPPRLPDGLGERDVDQPVLRVVHVDGALGHPVRDDRAGDDDAVAVHRLDPVVVLDADLRGVPVADPDRLAAARERQHEQVVLVLRVDRPLVVRGQVAHGQAGDRSPPHQRPAVRPEPSARCRARLAEQRGHVERRPEDRQLLAELGHPVVVEVEVLPPGQRVPRLEPLDVDGERRVAPAAGLRARPLRRGDHRHRRGLGVGEGDLLALVLGGEVGQPGAGALLEGLEALGGQVPVGGAGQREDRLAHVRRRGRSAGRPSATPPRTAPFLCAQVVDLACRASKVTPLVVAPSVVHQRAEGDHLLRDRAVVALRPRPAWASSRRGPARTRPSPSRATTPCGLAISSGVSCSSGTATRSLRTPRCSVASGR